jgi:diguanylate cyclase (GGDEF)-like protein
MPKILIADDNDDMLDTLDRIFKLYDFEVFTAINGKEAIKKAKLHAPDIIILDGMMPEMDGFEACKNLKKDEKTRLIPIVFLTANFMEIHDRVKGLALGADDYLLKPFNSKELVARIKSILKRTEITFSLKKENEKLIHQNRIIEDELKVLLKKHRIKDTKQITDPVTGLYTYSFFKEQAKNELIRSFRFNNELSLITIHFENAANLKEILGFQLFNYLVIKISNFVLNETRTIDIITYNEQKGFYILLPQTSKSGALLKLKKLKASLINKNFMDQEIIKSLEFSRKKLTDINKLEYIFGFASLDINLSILKIDDFIEMAEKNKQN